MIKPDVEAIFEFNGTRTQLARDGYRPHHLVKYGYLTTGIHHYYEVNEIAPNGKGKGTIAFIMPEAYPHCLWVGKEIPIQEGEKIVGCAVITQIFNPILKQNK